MTAGVRLGERCAMPRIAALLLAALALTVALSATATAGSAVETRCGDIVKKDVFDTPQDVRALGVSCKRAKKLARHHYRVDGLHEQCDLYRKTCKLDGFTCRHTFFGDSGTRVKCTSGNRRVRWFYGV
jgi:hypothetical protein